MKISDALYLGITDDRYSAGSEKTTAAGIVNDLVSLFPSQRAAATALGIPRTTLRRWAQGARPTPRGFALLQAAQRRVRLPAERERWMRHGWIVINASIRFSDSEEPFKRLISGWPNIPGAPASAQPQGMQGRILDAWLRADDLTAVQVILDVIRSGIDEQAGKDVPLTVVTVYSIRWYRTRGEALQAMRLREF